MLDAFFRGMYEGIGAGFIEIRPLLESTDPRYGTPEGLAVQALNRRWFSWPKELGACIHHCRDLNGKMHVYFGVGLRKAPGNGRKEDVGCVPCVFADVDFKDIPREEVHQRIRVFPMVPSACVRSGNGVHLYWFLNYPAFASRFDELEGVNRGILLALGAQEGVQNVDRILRVPGTLNIKSAYPEPKPRCEISWWKPDYRYDLERFSSLVPKPRELFTSGPEPSRSTPDRCVSQEGLRGCAELLTPAWLPGHRHYLAMHLGGWCAHAGLSLESAHDLIRAICALAHDDEIPNRLGAVTDSYRKFVEGDAVTGRRLLYDFLSKNLPPETAARAAAITAILESHMPKLEVERQGCQTPRSSSGPSGATSETAMSMDG